MAVSHKNIKADKLTIFTAILKVDAPEIRDFVIKNWREISVGLENSTALFIGGVHGDANGYLGGDANNMVQIMNQVSILDEQNYIDT